MPFHFDESETCSHKNDVELGGRQSQTKPPFNKLQVTSQRPQPARDLNTHTSTHVFRLIKAAIKMGSPLEGGAHHR